jgi:hypothetical protein
LLNIFGAEQFNVVDQRDDGVIRINWGHTLIDGTHQQIWVLHLRLDHRPQLLDQKAQAVALALRLLNLLVE